MQHLKVLVILLALCFQLPLAAQQNAKVYAFDMKEEIGPSAWRLTQKAFAKAKEQSSSVVLIRMNTYGGMVDFADSIRSKILNSDMKTIVFVDHNAASAGALIAIASDKIYMTKGSSIGAASVVNPQGEIMPEKYQSFMRGLMRSTAQAKNRNPQIAEAFVDPDIEIPGIVAKGKVLTLTSDEAVKVGYCAGITSNVAEVLKAEGLSKAALVEHEITTLDKILGFLISPAVSGILILLIIGGIYFEMQTPGIGFALLVSIVAALLYFAPLYLEGLADHWEIGLFIVGIVLILLEVFVIPGFGVAGILGIISIVAGLALSLVMNNWFDFTVTGSEQLSSAVILVLGSMILSIVLSVLLGKSIMRSPAFQRLVLQDEQRSQFGYVSGKKTVELINKVGVAVTDMRPSGKVEVDGKWYDGVALDGYILKGTNIQVERQENYNVFVRKKIV
ncbi:nodulation protein NfeD [Pedobacter sp. SYSU D00535]|uniref:NfeD family protein n=1 Tax=Pedobacter sp. SYSU D00535 TaxID=2810308 RepID=UPI001A9756A5|nr:NfeD family protein [Pedobacter sp. SYSU D00535]